MSDTNYDIEKIIFTKLMRMNATIIGLILGLTLGLAIFCITNFLLIKGGDVIGPHLALLGQFFIGYKVTFVGSIIGLFYGFVTGFISGFVFASLYNWVANLRDRQH